MCGTTGMELQLILVAGAWSPVLLMVLSSVCKSKKPPSTQITDTDTYQTVRRKYVHLSDGNDDILQGNSKPKSLWETLSEHRELDKSSEPVSTIKHAF